MLNWRDPQNPIAGGAERVSVAYLGELARRGHEIYWFANSFPGGKSEEVINGINYIRAGGKGTSVIEARKWYRRQKPFDLVIDQHHGIPWYAPWWCKTNCIAYIHEVLGPIWNSFYPWPTSVLGRCQERWTHWFYRNVTTWVPSESTRKALLAHGVRDVKAIPNGCDTVPLPSLEPKKLDSPLRLIAVSRIAPNKRVDHAVKAVPLLQRARVNVHLTVVGGGDSRESLKELAKQLDLGSNVTFTGPLPEEDKNRELRQAHLLVHTSLREGWGLNVLEANAMGTPAAVYPVAGLVDSTVRGETGWITNSETPAALAETLQRLVQRPDEYSQYRTNAWERTKQFQWDKILPPACDWLESQAAKKR
jgi:glycosyltransferase involved in cell wall biosynthesis